MAGKYVNVMQEGPVTFLELNRPERLNAINRVLMSELRQNLEDLRMSTDTRVVVLTGAGRGFCSGADLKASREEVELDGTDPENGVRRRLRHEVQAVIRLLHEGLDFPTIAMVNGAAVGGGFELALACDLRVGSENARFQVRFTTLGTTSPSSTWLLPRLIGYAKAAEYFLTDEFISAEEALRLGILNRLVPAKKLRDETMLLAGKIAEYSPVAIRLMKLLLRKGEHLDFGTALDISSLGMAFSTRTRGGAER